MEVDKKEMWEALSAVTISEHIRLSIQQGEPTQGLLKWFVTIANKSLNRASYVHLTFKEEIVHDAIIQMLKHWRKADGCGNAFAYFYQITIACAHQHMHQENRQRQIKELLIDSCVW
jgi:hypothetical protein